MLSEAISASEAAVVSGYFNRLKLALEGLDTVELGRLVCEIQRIRTERRLLFVAGNGGSAATASHLATDWMLGTNLQPPLKVISLAESVSAVSATSNDLSFEFSFSRPLRALGSRGDGLLLISASGNSSNLLEAATAAEEIGISVMSMTGFDGGLLRKRSHINAHVKTDPGDYGVAEDFHMMFCHAIKEVLIGVPRPRSAERKKAENDY